MGTASRPPDPTDSPAPGAPYIPDWLWYFWLTFCAVVVAGLYLTWALTATQGPSAPSSSQSYRQTADSTRPATVAPQAAGTVWVNTHSHIYHYQGQRWYGHTIQGKYMKEADAIAEGDRATRNGQ